MIFSWRASAHLAYAAALLAIVCWFVIDFPIYRLPIAFGFVIYGACLWRWPWLWLTALPALLPLFDLAPLSGRFFFDEFDALVLLTVAVLTLHDRGRDAPAPLPRSLRWVLALLIVSYTVSTLIRLWPPVPITADSFANYTSPYNSLRVAKGFVWSLLLLRLLRQAAQRYDAYRLLLGLGFVCGLAGVALVSLYERWLFAGVLTWVTDYRTTSSFSSMHIGDGPIDVWYAMTIPFLGLLLLVPRWTRLLPVTVAVTLLAAYGLFVTQSRGPVIAVAVAFLVGFVALVATRTILGRTSAALFTILGTLGIVAVLGIPVLAQSSFAERFSRLPQDALQRVHHWNNALDLRDQSLSARLIGMGLGSFPAIHQQRSINEPRASRYEFVSNDSGHFLTIWSGQTLYMGQALNVERNPTYLFQAKVRTAEQHATFIVTWCERWLLFSRGCTWDSFALNSEPGLWQTLQRPIIAKDIGSGKSIAGVFVQRPTRLDVLVTEAPTSGVDIGQLSLKDSVGREQISNGDFSHGNDRWFWSVDRDLQWHTLNAIVDILFEQGWIGIASIASLLWIALRRLASRIAEGDTLSAVWLASLMGTIINGTTVAIFDQPRLVLAFYLLCFSSLGSNLSNDKMGTLSVVHQSAAAM